MNKSKVKYVSAFLHGVVAVMRSVYGAITTRHAPEGHTTDPRGYNHKGGGYGRGGKVPHVDMKLK